MYISLGKIDAQFAGIDQVYALIPTDTQDYKSATVELVFEVFGSGFQRQCFTIDTSTDSIPESLETFEVAISSTSNSQVVIGEPDSTVVEIDDDDSE